MVQLYPRLQRSVIRSSVVFGRSGGEKADDGCGQPWGMASGRLAWCNSWCVRSVRTRPLLGPVRTYIHTYVALVRVACANEPITLHHDTTRERESRSGGWATRKSTETRGRDYPTNLQLQDLWRAPRAQARRKFSHTVHIHSLCGHEDGRRPARRLMIYILPSDVNV